jgi:hypothetical protein
VDRILTRNLKNHYLSRWAVMRHNQKNDNKILLFEDQFVLKNINSGTTACYNCLGEMYQDIIPNLECRLVPCDNLVLINNLEFKYKTVDEITQLLLGLAQKHLSVGGRIILSIQHRFLIYNRCVVSVDSLLATWFDGIKEFKVLKALNLLGKTQPGYGDYFFVLEYSHE